MSTILSALLTIFLCASAIVVAAAEDNARSEDNAPADTSLPMAFDKLYTAKSAKDSINAYNSIGWSLYNSREFNQAAEMFRGALNMSISTGDKKNTALCYQNIANAMAQMGQYNESNEYNHKALSIYYELNNQEAVSNLSKTIGLMCIQHHLYKTAAEYLNQALAIDTVMNIRSHGNHIQDIAFDYLYLGYADINKYKDTRNLRLLHQAQEQNMKAYRMLLPTENKIGLLYSSKNLMDSYFEFARISGGRQRELMLDSSRMYHNIGTKLMNETGFRMLAVDFMLWEAKYAIEKRQFDRAWNLFRQIANTISNDNMSDTYRIEYGYAMADYYEAIGHYRLAYEWSNRTTKAEKRQLNREFAVKSAKLSVRNEFDEILQQHETEKEHEMIMRHEQELRLAIVTTVIIVVLIMITILTITIYNGLKRKKRLEKKLTERNEELESQKDQLEFINDQLASNMNFARHMQKSMLPTDSQMRELFDDVLILWRPLDLVSGDFYWAAQVGNRKLFTIADCTGHGVPGGFISMLGISLLSDITLMPEFKSGEMDAGSILNMMRAKVAESLRQSEGSLMAIDGMDTALCILNTDTMEMQYAGAFRPAILARDGELTEFKGNKMPISYISDNPKPFSTKTISLEKGDTIYLFSDGISDQFGYNEKGEEAKFSGRRLLRLLKACCSKPFAEQKSQIEAAIDNWRAPTGRKTVGQTDDIILLGVKI